MFMKGIEMKKIVVIGSMNLDYTIDVKEMPLVGETILGKDMVYSAGGKGANQASAIAKLGGNVSILGAVGNDSNGKMEMDALKEVGVNVDNVIVKDDVPTGLAIITVNEAGENSIIVISGANYDLSPEDIQENTSVIEDADIVIFQLEIPIDTVVWSIKEAKRRDKFVILDPAPANSKLDKEIYSYVDIITPNETELSILTDMPDAVDKLEEACNKLHSYGAKGIIVTLGDKGSYLSTIDGQRQHFPCHKVDAVDTTAAGDAFTASVSLMLLQDKSLEEAIEFATKVSAVTVTRRGAIESIPTMEELNNEYK